MIDSILGNLRTHGLSKTVQKAWRRVVMSVDKARLRGSGSESVMSRYGVLMSANWGDATFESCVLGVYGNFLSDRLAQHPEPYIFVDIGANQGLYSLIAAKQQHCVRAIALEPVGATYRLLSNNIDLNQLRDKIVPLQFGISAEAGTFPIYLTANHSGVASLNNKDGGSQVEYAEIQTASALEQHLPDKLPIAIKIDVEGHEVEVVRSLVEATYANRISWIFCEVDERWIDPVKLVELMKEIGMTQFEKVGAGIHYDLIACR